METKQALKKLSEICETVQYYFIVKSTKNKDYLLLNSFQEENGKGKQNLLLRGTKKEIESFVKGVNYILNGIKIKTNLSFSSKNNEFKG
jgi:hypothetical protein